MLRRWGCFFFVSGIVIAGVAAAQSSVLLINDVPIECINFAAVRYHMPATLIISTLETENGRIGDARQNRNGTVDYGPMQINSIWLPKVAPYGYTSESLQYNPCANVEVGTWILAQAVAESGDLWQGVGNYHSHNPGEKARYTQKILRYYQALLDLLRRPSAPVSTSQ